jgi:hypothetical protein
LALTASRVSGRARDRANVEAAVATEAGGATGEVAAVVNAHLYLHGQTAGFRVITAFMGAVAHLTAKIQSFAKMAKITFFQDFI